MTIATDYNGYAGQGVVPRVVTMNHAHTSHYTDTSRPGIEHVLRGWNPEGGKAVHHLEVDDVLIRNVTTDIRSFGFDGGMRVPDGNSIFIFEVARLCIGHLGHLHHVLGAEDLAFIGQLDIVMVPVDGSMTMDQAAMVETLKVVKARLVLPMHYFGLGTLQPLPRPTSARAFEIEISRVPEIVVSVRTLPQSPEGAGAAGLLAKQPAAHATLSRRAARRRRPAPGTSARRLRSARRIRRRLHAHHGAHRHSGCGGWQ